MTTQEEFDDFTAENQDRLREMRSELSSLFIDFSNELEDLELDEDNANQIITDLFDDPFGVGEI